MRSLPETALVLLCACCAYGQNQADALARRRQYCTEAAKMRAVYQDTLKKVDAPAEDVTVPIEMNEDGSVKSFVHAGEAQYFVTDGLIWARDVVLKQVGGKGETEAVITARQCVVDRKAKCGWAEGFASADYGPHHLEGDGVYFSLEDRYFRISDRTVLTSRGFHIGSASLRSPELAVDTNAVSSAKLSSRRADYDNKSGVALFDGDIVVDDGEYRLGADRLWVFSQGTNSISRLEALGAVTVTNGTRSASCARVEFDAASKRLTMHSDARRPAELVETGEHRSRLVGDTITFWIESEQVEVEHPRMSIEIEGGEEWKRTLSQRP